MDDNEKSSDVESLKSNDKSGDESDDLEAINPMDERYQLKFLF